MRKIKINNQTYKLLAKGELAMKPVLSITEDQALLEMRQNWLHKDPDVQARIRISAAEIVEASTISWRAGFQAGLASAVMSLKEDYPQIAQELMEAFNGEETKIPDPVPMVKKSNIPLAH